MKVHPVINVPYTTPYVEQLEDISSRHNKLPEPMIGPQGPECEPEAMLQHRKRGKSYQFSVQWKGYLTYDASWEPTRHFVSNDGPHGLLVEYLQDNSLDAEVVIPKGRQ